MASKKDFPCRCGHAKSFHKRNKRLAGICLHTEEEGVYYSDNCSCYVPDNLLYLELKAKDHDNKNS